MKHFKKMYALFFFMGLTIPIFAYLDPATGNVLVYVVISLLGAVIYSLKGFFYFLAQKLGFIAKTETQTDCSKLILFCEGKQYWNTFKPIVSALREQKTPFSYYTMDIEDPALEIEDENMFSRFLGTGSAGFARLSRLKANIMLATTPNIGTAGYPLPRPKNIKKLIHVYHAIDDMAFYKKGSLDYYNGAILPGDFCEKSVRELEKKRNLPQKELITLGIPYFDDLATKMPTPLPQTDGKTILIAPSWGTKGCLSHYGSQFIIDLAKKDYNLIIRPHPQSFKVEKELISKLKKECSAYSNITWDSEADGTKAMLQSDILITDVSAIKVDYAFLYNRPVITLKTPISDFDSFEAAELDTIWMQKIETKLGIVLTEKTITAITSHIELLLKNKNDTDLYLLRDKTIANFGQSGKKIAEYLTKNL